MVNFYSMCKSVGAKALTILTMVLLGASTVKAQIPAVAYSFTASSQTYTALSGSTPFSFSNCDDGYYMNIPLGFTFTFCGVNYTQVSASSNGFLCFANNTSASNGNSSGGGIQPAAFPLWDDISGCNTTSVASYLTTGISGSKIFTLEFKDWCWMYNTSSNAPKVLSFQIKLYEATGRVEFVYQQGTDGIYNSPSASIGIMKSSSDYQTLTSSGTSPSISTSSFYTSINSKPASGQSYAWDPPPPCPTTLPFTLLGYNSQAASIKWTAASGAISYDYAIDQNADRAPATATTITTTPSALTASFTGLLASTTYYIHVRSKCSQYSFSKWDTLSFTTLPPCSKPGRIITSYIDSSSIKFSWPGVPAATTYQYFIDSVSKAAPTTAVGATPSTTGYVELTGLKEGKVYYVKYRSLCASNDSSAWAIDSFRIPVPCRRPVLEILNLTSGRIIANWKPVNTAVSYEYYLGEPSAPPAFGTPVYLTTMQLPLQPMTEYNLHVRCSCSYFGISTVSGWSTLDFTSLPPLEINNIPGNDQNISVYPNPVKDELHVNIQGIVGSGATISITDIKGQTVKTVNATGNAVSVDMHNIAAGTYFIKYNDGDTHKTIKVTKE